MSATHTRSQTHATKTIPLLYNPSVLGISRAPRNVAIIERIALNDTENRICALLVDVANYLNDTRPQGHPKLTLRIAGGWVRDKMLGLESHDLDIALDTLMGFEFAQAVNDYIIANLETPEQRDLRLAADAAAAESLANGGSGKKKGGSGGGIVGSIAKIDSNPEKSKHLETATAKVFGQMVDFVNLRTETYREDSRIPQMEFGTPTQDALRRDITINALFYNLHTREIEDFTTLGKSDLRAGHIRTPLPPLQTFLDDPLRILRVIRFASRFHFSIEPEILRVCREDAGVRAALGTKISRERIGVEVDKMLRARVVRDVERAVRLVHEFGIAGDVLVEAPVDMRYFGPLGSGGVVIPPPPLPSVPPVSSALSGTGSPMPGTHAALSSSLDSGASNGSLLEAALGQVDVDLVAGLRVAEALTLLLDSGSAVRIEKGVMKELIPESCGLSVPLGVEEVRLLYLSAMVSPYMGRLYLEKKKNVMPGAKYVIMNSLKLSALDADWVSSMLTFVPQIQVAVNKIYRERQERNGLSATSPVDGMDYAMDIANHTHTSSSSSSVVSPTSPLSSLSSPMAASAATTRKSLGLVIREWGAKSIYTACRPLGGKYALAVFLSMGIEVARTLACGSGGGGNQPTLTGVSADAIREVVERVIAKYRVFWGVVVREHGVDASWQLKPLLNGGEVSAHYGIKAGPVVGRILQMMVEYQLEHAEAGREEVTRWLATVDPLQVQV